MINLDQIKKMRELTGAGLTDIKKALEEARGNEEKATDILRKRGKEKAIEKRKRLAKEGVIAIYLHSNKKIGAMVKLFCETDFVARNEEFQELAKDIAMHIAALDPKFLKPEDVSLEIVEKEKEIWREQLKEEGKSEDLIKKVIMGKEKKFREESALITQAFVKNPEMTIGTLLNEKIGKIGENIQIGEFVRFEL